jgi:hypothetical protein
MPQKSGAFLSKKLGVFVLVLILVTGGVLFAVVFPSLLEKKSKTFTKKPANTLYTISEIESANRKKNASTAEEEKPKITDYVIPEVNLEDLTEFVQSDDVCKIENSTYSLDDAAMALLQAPDVVKVDSSTDRILLDLFNKDVNMAKSKEADNINKFFNALMLSDMFFSAESAQVDFSKAQELLQDLTESDSDNGVYNFTLAYILSKMNAPDEVVKTEFKKAFQKPRFDIYSDLIQKRLHEKSFSSASHWLIYLTIQERLDEINLAAPTFLLHKYIQKNDQAFNRDAAKFAQLMIPSHVKEGIPPHLSNWDRSSYIFGQKILAWAWPSAYPGKPKPGFDPLKRLMVVNLNTLDQGTEAFRNLRKSGSNFFTCKREFFDVWFTQSKIQELDKRE